jgi:hypothetical protein
MRYTVPSARCITHCAAKRSTNNPTITPKNTQNVRRSPGPIGGRTHRRTNSPPPASIAIGDAAYRLRAANASSPERFAQSRPQLPVLIDRPNHLELLCPAGSGGMSRRAIARNNAEWIWELYVSQDRTADARHALLTNLDGVSSSATVNQLFERAIEVRDLYVVRALHAAGHRPADDLLERPLTTHDFELVEELLAMGTTLGGLYTGTAGTPGPWLFLAVAWGDLELAEFLLSKGADANQEYDDETPLLVAAAKNQPAFVGLFLRHGADPSVSRWQGTAEQIAQAKGFDDVLAALNSVRNR